MDNVAMAHIERDRFYFEARAYMDRYEVPPEDFEKIRLSLMHRAFMEEIQPIIRQIASVEMFAQPTYLHHQDGRIEKSSDGLTEPMRENIAALKGQIEFIRASYNFLPSPCPHSTEG